MNANMPVTTPETAPGEIVIGNILEQELAPELSVTMLNGCSKLNFRKGDDFYILVTVLDKEGNPVNITGWVLLLTLKSNLSLLDEQAELTTESEIIQGIDALLGTAIIPLPKELTKNLDAKDYFLDIQRNTLNTITTPIYSLITVLPEVTQRVA